MITYEELTASISKALDAGTHSSYLDRGAIKMVAEIAVNRMLGHAELEVLTREVRYIIKVSCPKKGSSRGMDLTEATDEQLQEEIGKRYAKRIQEGLRYQRATEGRR